MTESTWVFKDQIMYIHFYILHPHIVFIVLLNVYVIFNLIKHS